MNPVADSSHTVLPDAGGDPVRRRHRRIAAAGLSALAGKGTSLLVNALTVPITVRYLGAESYGLWIAISSTVTMFFVMDLGISSTLTNLISEAYARDDQERAAEYFSTAFWILSGIAVCLGIAGWLAWNYVPWAALFNVTDAGLARDTSRALAAAFVVFLVALPSSLASKVLGGYQELHTANLFVTGGSIICLLLVVLVVLMHGSLPVLVGTYAGSTVMANIACLAWMCLYRKPWMKPWPRRVRLQMISQIFRAGTQFFAIQLAGLVVFSSDNLIISHYLNAAQVTPYAVTWKLVNYIAAVQTLIFPALWPAYSEAYALGHLDWIRSTYRRVRWITILVLATGCSITALAGRSIIRVWAGPAAVPTLPLLWLMCVWIVIFAISTNQSCLMGATFRVGKQAAFGLIAGVLNLGLSIVWVRPMGPAGVLCATIVSYLAFVIVVQTWEVKRILRGDFLQA